MLLKQAPGFELLDEHNQIHRLDAYRGLLGVRPSLFLVFVGLGKGLRYLAVASAAAAALGAP